MSIKLVAFLKAEFYPANQNILTFFYFGKGGIYDICPLLVILINFKRKMIFSWFYLTLPNCICVN